jgi:hypothetical protein
MAKVSDQGLAEICSDAGSVTVVADAHKLKPRKVGIKVKPSQPTVNLRIDRLKIVSWLKDACRRLGSFNRRNPAKNSHFLVSGHGTSRSITLLPEELIDEKRKQMPSHDRVTPKKHSRFTKWSA